MARVPERLLAKKIAIHIGSGDLLALLDRQNCGNLPTATRPLPQGGIGVVGASLPETGNLLVFTGVPIRAPDTLDWRNNSTETIQAVTSLDGAFIAIHWDDTANTLTLVTDRLGLQPAYYRRDESGFTVVSDTRALPAQPDFAGWGGFFALGHTIADRTLAEGLRRLPPASVIRYRPVDGCLTIDRYWDWPSPTTGWRTFDFVEALVDDIEHYGRYAPTGSTLLLSGGLDSRLLLGALTLARQDVQALVVAHPGELRGADSRYAVRAAKVMGVRYRQVAATEPFFSRRPYLRYLEAMDAAFPTLDLFIPRVASVLPNQPVWDGFMPDYLFSAHQQPRGAFAAYWQQEVRKPGSRQWQAVRELFHDEVAEAMWQGFQDDYSLESNRWPQDEFGLAGFRLNNRGRNRPAMNPLKVYANHALPFIPGASAEMLSHAAGLPAEERRGARFHMRLLRRIGRHTLVAPLISGGSPIRRSRTDFAYWSARLQEEAVSRLPTRLRRRPYQASLSAFIGDWLIEPHDERWIRPTALQEPPTASPSQALIWKLFFYWKAWEWTHDGTLYERLASRALG